MNCLLVSATSFEIAPFLDKLQQKSGSYTGLPPDVLVTGIGLTAAAYAITRQLQLKRYDLAIQAGIAGCFDRGLPLGKVVVIGRDTIADQGVLENKTFNTVFDMKLVPENKFPYTKGWLVNPHKELLKQTGLKAVKGISVNEISTGRGRIQLLEAKYAGVAESMEGAAFHYTCLMEGVPFVQLRSLSNYTGERNKAKWKMKDAMANLNDTLSNIFNSYR